MWDQICRSQWPTVTQSCPSMWFLELGRWRLSHGTRGRSKQGPQEREETQSFETLLFPALWVAGGHWALWLVEDGDSDDHARIYIWHLSLSHSMVYRQPSALPGVHCSCADGPPLKWDVSGEDSLEFPIQGQVWGQIFPCLTQMLFLALFYKPSKCHITGWLRFSEAGVLFTGEPYTIYFFLSCPFPFLTFNVERFLTLFFQCPRKIP